MKHSKITRKKASSLGNKVAKQRAELHALKNKKAIVDKKLAKVRAEMQRIDWPDRE